MAGGIDVLSIFIGADAPPPAPRRTVQPVELPPPPPVVKVGARAEYTREQQCEIAVLQRENDALRRNNNWQAKRIVELELELVELRKHSMVV